MCWGPISGRSHLHKLWLCPLDRGLPFCLSVRPRGLFSARRRPLVCSCAPTRSGSVGAYALRFMEERTDLLAAFAARVTVRLSQRR